MPASRTLTAYPSEITEAAWERIAPVLPPPHRRGRQRSTDLRDIVNAIKYREVSGCAWRMLPHDFPAWGTVYSYFRQWRTDGTWDAIQRELRRKRGR